MHYATTKIRISNKKKRFSLNDRIYAQSKESCWYNLAAIGELVTGRDQILQLLGGLGADYNSIVALLTAHEDDISLHSIHGILLTHEQRLCFQNLVVENDVIATNIATSQYLDHYNKKNQNCNNFIPNKNDYGHKPSRRSNGGPSQGIQTIIQEVHNANYVESSVSPL